MRLQKTHNFSKTVFRHGVGKTMSQKLTFSHPINIQKSQYSLTKEFWHIKMGILGKIPLRVLKFL